MPVQEYLLPSDDTLAFPDVVACLGTPANSSARVKQWRRLQVFSPPKMRGAWCPDHPQKMKMICRSNTSCEVSLPPGDLLPARHQRHRLLFFALRQASTPTILPIRDPRQRPLPLADFDYVGEWRGADIVESRSNAALFPEFLGAPSLAPALARYRLAGLPTRDLLHTGEIGEMMLTVESRPPFLPAHAAEARCHRAVHS